MLSLCKRRGFIYPAYEIYGARRALRLRSVRTALKGNIADRGARSTRCRRAS